MWRGEDAVGVGGKALTADYVLEYRNTKLAVIEAKAWDEALTEGVAQAKNYAGKQGHRAKSVLKQLLQQFKSCAYPC